MLVENYACADELGKSLGWKVQLCLNVRILNEN